MSKFFLAALTAAGLALAQPALAQQEVVVALPRAPVRRP